MIRRIRMRSTGPLRPAPVLSEGLASAINDTASMLRVTAVNRRGQAVLLRVGGEIDASNVITWTRILDEVASATAAPGAVVIDLNGVEFMGGCAFTALADQSAQWRRRGIEFRLVSNRPITARILAACQFQDQLPLYRDVAAARRAFTTTADIPAADTSRRHRSCLR